MKLSAALFATACITAVGIGVYARGRAVDDRRAEDVVAQAQADPPIRTVVLGEGRVLECSVFPLRSYDGMLQRCVICEDQDFDVRAKPRRMLSCR